MKFGGHGRWPLLGMTPMVLLVLGLQLQGSASRCIDTVLGEDLQPLPPGVQRCSLPSGLLQPDLPQPGQGGGSSDGGGSRIVGGSPAVSGNYGGSSAGGGSAGNYGGGSAGNFGGGSSGNFGGGSSGGGSAGNFGGGSAGNFGGGSSGGGSAGVGPTPQGGGPYPPGGPNKLGPFGRPIGPIIASGSSQSGPYGRPGGYPGQYGGGPFGYDRGYSNPGHLKPVAKPPGIPYIPSARERGGGHIPVPRDSRPFNPNAPYSGPYGGGAGSYGGGASTYGGGAGSYSGEAGSYGGGAGSTYSNEPVGPRGRGDGSYGPVPFAAQPGSQSSKDIPPIPPCKPNNDPC